MNSLVKVGELGMYSVPTIISSETYKNQWKGIDYLNESDFLKWFDLFENCKDGPFDDKIEPVVLFPTKDHSTEFLNVTKSFVKKDFVNEYHVTICRLVKVNIFIEDNRIVILDSSRTLDDTMEEVDTKERLNLKDGVFMIFPGEISGESIDIDTNGLFKSNTTGQEYNDVGRFKVREGIYGLYELYEKGLAIGIIVKYIMPAVS